ncbi:MAG: histidine kinase N-terminal 7TM domain-containing protein [bacterium]
MEEFPWFDVIILISVGVLDLIFAIYLFNRYQKTASIIFFGFFALFVSLWVLSNAFGLVFEPGSSLVEYIWRTAFVSAVLLFPFLYLFVLSYPLPPFQINWRLILFALSPAIIMSVLIYSTDSFIIGFANSRFGTTEFGSAYVFYTWFIILIYILILVEMINKVRRLDGLHKKQMQYFLYAILIAGVIGILFNLVLPYFFDLEVNYWIGPASSIIWLGFMLYVIRRRI